MLGSGGDGLAFFTVSDALAIQFDVPGETTRLERQARRARVEAQDLGRVQPLLLERSLGPATGIPTLAPPQVSAVMVTLQPGADAAKVAASAPTTARRPLRRPATARGRRPRAGQPPQPHPCRRTHRRARQPPGPTSDGALPQSRP